MAGNELLELAEQLIKRTEDGKVTWESTGDDGFAFAGTRASVVIRSKDKDQAHPFIFSLFEGDVLVDTLASGFHGSEDFEDIRGAPYAWNDTLEKLYYNARRSALKLNELAASILHDIDESGA